MLTFKLIQSAEKRWNRLRGFDQLANVIQGVKFRDGVEVSEVVENSENQHQQRIAA